VRKQTLIATTALTLLVAGCGGGNSTATVPADGPITKAEATAYAHHVNLGVADVPGMVSTSLEHENHERDLVNSECRLHEIETHLVDIQSPTFRSGTGLEEKSVRSDVEVMPSAALASGKFSNEQRVLASARDRACLTRAYSQAFVTNLRHGLPGGVRLLIGHTTLSVLHPPVPGSLGLRIVVPFTIVGPAGSLTASLEVDGVGFVHGAAAVNLLATGTGGPLPTEQHLLSVLYGRGKA
jgi:hypothetical protein